MKYLKKYQLFESTTASTYVNWETIDLNALFDELNKQLFNSELPKIPVELVKRGSFSGRFLSNYNDKTELYVGEKIQLSTKYKFTLAVLKDILAHEMIHLKLVNVEGKLGTHKTPFVQEMNRINKDYGFNITLKHDVTDFEMSEVKDMSNSVYTVIYSMIEKEVEKKFIICITGNMVDEVATKLKLYFTKLSMMQKAPLEVSIYKTNSSLVKRFKCARAWSGIKYFYELTDSHYEQLKDSLVLVKSMVFS